MDSHTDSSQRFLFDEADVRGESVRISAALDQMLANQSYSPALRTLLGEFAAAAVLISNNLKYTGRITLQARSEQAVSLVMVECSSERHIRGIAQGDLAAEATNPITLLAGGQLVLTVERDAGQRYQGIIALDQGNPGRSAGALFFSERTARDAFLADLGWAAQCRADAAAIARTDCPRGSS